MTTDVLSVICAVIVVGGMTAFVVDRWWLVWDWWPLVGWEWRAERADRRQLEATRQEIAVALLDGEEVIDEDCADGLHDYCLTAYCDCFCHRDLTGPLIEQSLSDDESWADELHAINQELHGNVIQGQFGDLSRPVHELTHYEVEAVIVRLGHADWLPAAA